MNLNSHFNCKGKQGSNRRKSSNWRKDLIVIYTMGLTLCDKFCVKSISLPFAIILHTKDPFATNGLVSFLGNAASSYVLFSTTIKEALNGKHSKLWEEAIDVEYHSLANFLLQALVQLFSLDQF